MDSNEEFLSPTTQQRLKVFLTGAIEEASLIFSTGKLSQEQKFFFSISIVSNLI